MSFSRVAEDRIRRAMADGEFDNLPGAGRPLDLELYFQTPEDLRMAYSLLNNAGAVPLEVEVLNEVARLERALVETADPALRRGLQRELTGRRTQLAVMLEHRSRKD